MEFSRFGVRSLLILGKRYEDRPGLPNELARISKDGGLALVLFAGTQDVQVFWPPSALEEVEGIVRNLSRLDGATSNMIGYVSLPDQTHPGCRNETLSQIRPWMEEKGLSDLPLTSTNSPKTRQ